MIGRVAGLTLAWVLCLGAGGRGLAQETAPGSAPAPTEASASGSQAKSEDSVPASEGKSGGDPGTGATENSTSRVSAAEKASDKPNPTTAATAATAVSPKRELGELGESGESTPVSSDPTKELRASDRLRFRIEEDPAKAATPLIVLVNGLGEASFPVTRDSDIRVTLAVRGKRLGQVREELVARLLEDYYNRATVELGVEEKVGITGKAQFFGEMGGTIPITADQPVKLSEAILQLRAPESARLSRVRVHRENPATGQTTVLEVDVDAINKRGQREKDIVLQDGDRIEVRQKWFN